MVAGAGFEPAAFGLWAQRATELLHPAIYFAHNQWRRKRDSNPRAGYPTSRFSRPVPSTRLGYFSKKYGASGRTWTGTWFNSRRILSPVRLPIPPLRHIMVTRIRFELMTLWLKVRCSTGWANWTYILKKWLPRQDSNLRMSESKSDALPLGDEAI